MGLWGEGVRTDGRTDGSNAQKMEGISPVMPPLYAAGG